MIWLFVFLMFPLAPIFILQIARYVVELLAEGFNFGE